VQNGSFESPVVTPGTFILAPPNTIPNWSVVGPAGTDVGVVSTTFTQGGFSFPAEDGVQWLDLTGLNSNSTEGVAQTVTTILGHTYQLSYFIGNTTAGTPFGTMSTVNVSINGVPTFSDTNSDTSPAGGTTQDWKQFTHTFVATGGSTTLTFLNGDPSTDNNNGLDNVVLNDLGVVGTPVPEPASAALVVSGLVGLGVLSRRKRSK